MSSRGEWDRCLERHLRAVRARLAGSVQGAASAQGAEHERLGDPDDLVDLDRLVGPVREPDVARAIVQQTDTTMLLSSLVRRPLPAA